MVMTLPRFVSMRLVIGLVSVTVLASIAACSSTTQPDTANEVNALLASPDTVMLAPSDTSQSVMLALMCGCKFPLSLEAATGNQSAFRYSFSNETLGDTLNNHYLRIAPTPGTPAGSYAMQLAFSGPKVYAGKRTVYYDTVRAFLNVP